MNLKTILLGVSYLLLNMTTAFGGTHGHHSKRHHDAHTHKEGALEMIYEDGTLELRLELTADDVFGVTRLPSTSKRGAFNQKLKAIKEKQDFYSMIAKGECRLVSQDVEHSLTSKSKHAEVEIHSKFKCTSLESIRVNVFDLFPSVQELDYRGSFGSKSLKGEVTPKKRNITVR